MQLSRPILWKPLKILSCGVGMQSTALALMACENALACKTVHPDVPVYDAILFCDLGAEPVWVHDQVAFTQKACKAAGIPFYILRTNLYGDLSAKLWPGPRLQYSMVDLERGWEAGEAAPPLYP